jgi:hypothetical protein
LYRKDWLTPFNLELNAYELILQHRDAHNYVPKIYGYDARKLSEWGVAHDVGDDDLYEDENHRFYGIVLEWIENAEQLSTENVTGIFASTFIAGLCKIHDAGVLHFDAYSRNQLVVPSAERAVWIDFSCAHFDDGEHMANEMFMAGGIIMERVSPNRVSI